jgi:hypothetical protein
MANVYTTALGIATGDIVRTSYGTGPYEVYQVHGPTCWSEWTGALTIWPYPVVSLTCIEPGEKFPYWTERQFYLNNLHREGDRYFDNGHSEILVERRPGPILQMALFDQNPEVAPYQYQDGVDYGAGDLYVFHCRECGKDFNGQRETKWVNPIHCGFLPALSIINMGICHWPLKGRCPPSGYVRGLG